jgi:hypothetical protein
MAENPSLPYFMCFSYVLSPTYLNVRCAAILWSERMRFLCFFRFHVHFLLFHPKTKEKCQGFQKKIFYVFFLCVVSNILQFQVRSHSLERENAVLVFFSLSRAFCYCSTSKRKKMTGIPKKNILCVFPMCCLQHIKISGPQVFPGARNPTFSIFPL